MREPDIKRSGNRQLANLLSVQDDADWGPDDMGAILAHQLSAPFDEKLAQLNPAGLPTLQDLPPSTKSELQTIEDVLTHPAPPLEYLLCVKRFGKTQGLLHDLPQEVAGLIYLGAIAAGRLRCGQRISEMDDATFVKRLKWATAQPFVGGKLRAVFDETLKLVAGNS